MSLRRWGSRMFSVACFGALAPGACAPSHEQEVPLFQLGRVATDSEVVAWDIDVNGNGVGLPTGSGNAADGARYYAALCAQCHGGRGEGTATAAQLVRPETTVSAPRRNIASHWPFAPPLFDYIRRSMPPDSAVGFGADTLYAIVAFLLEANRIPLPEGRADSATLPRVAMPARALFTPDDRRGGRELR
jgi:S-disulfanyl-L-cysteine oxidoreductase SoxD